MRTLPFTSFDALIVGSGPAGVSAAWPMVRAGLRVLMVDGGKTAPQPDLRTPFRKFRETARNQWDLLLGRDDWALSGLGLSSPKFRTPTHRHVFDGFVEHAAIITQGFFPVGSLAVGGLSNAWGAAVSCFDEQDLAEFPFDRSELLPSYRDVAARIGVSGSETDALAAFHGKEHPLQPPARLGENASRLLGRYERKPAWAHRRGFILGQGRNAVLTLPLGERAGCVNCAMCMWGCSFRSIYSSAFELAPLSAHNNFQHLPGLRVIRLEAHAGQWRLQAQDTIAGGSGSFLAPNVFLACGTLGTTRLVLNALGLADYPVRLLSQPVAGFAVCLPERIGTAVPEEDFGLAQLTYLLRHPETGYSQAAGHFYPTTGLPTAEFISRVPFTYAGARQAMRLLQPSLLVGDFFMPSRFTNHQIWMDGHGRLNIRGAYLPELTVAFAELRSRLMIALARYGAFLLPYSMKLTEPGEDLHYGGTVPMVRDPAPHQADSQGQVAGLPGVYVVDGAALPDLSMKTHTFTLMANADRIAQRFVRGRSRG